MKNIFNVISIFMDFLKKLYPAKDFAHKFLLNF